MNNFELHDKAIEMSDKETAYNIARKYVELEYKLKELFKDAKGCKKCSK